MPYRKMTPEETRAWLGEGLVVPVRKVPNTGSPSLQQTDLTQVEHDRLTAQQTPAQYRRMIAGLGTLARSKLGGR